MNRLEWTRTKEDGYTVLRSGEYEIVELYEPGLDGARWQINCRDYYIACAITLHEARLAAEEHNRFN